MNNEEIRKKLMEAQKGGILIIDGPGHRITKVVDYKLRTETWRDLICVEDGKVFKLTNEDVIKVWCETKELPKSVVFGDDFIVFRGEKLYLEAIGWPLVTVNRKPEDGVSYAVYIGKSGAVVCLEEWPWEGLKAYYLEKEIALSDVEIIYL